MALKNFLKKNSINTMEWEQILSKFRIKNKIIQKSEYMNKEYFIVSNNEKEYVPRVKKINEKNNILYEHKVINFVNKNVVNVGKPLKTDSGEELFEFNDKIICFYEKLGGHHYKGSEKELFNATKTIAKLHSIGKKFKQKKEPYFFDGNFKKLLNIKKTNIGVIKKAIKRIESKNIMWNKLDKSLVHGDMHPGNVLFKNNKVEGLLDLEVSNVDSTATDLVWMLRTFSSKKNWQKTGAFDIDKLEKAKKIYKKNYKTNFEYFPELLLGHYITYVNELIGKNKKIQEDIIQIKWILKNY